MWVDLHKRGPPRAENGSMRRPLPMTTNSLSYEPGEHLMPPSALPQQAR